MAITRHSDPDAFLAAAAPLLDANAAVRSFACAVADGWRADRADFVRGAYIATFAAGSHRGLAVRRRGGPLILENSAPLAARAFADDLPAKFRTLPSVGGERAACEAFAQRWNARFGTSHEFGVHMRHHVLTSLSSMPQPPGAYRSAEEADREWLAARSLAFAQEAGLTDSRQMILEGVRKRLARRGYRIWQDGTRVAFAGWSTAGADTARIAPVYTEPAARRRGYAGALVAALAGELIAQGRQAIFLLTDVANPTSNALYARIGFRPLSDTFRFDFTHGVA